MNNKPSLILIIVLMITCTGIILTGSLSAGSVPDFSLKKLDGSVFNFREYIGKKIVVIDFWATWCKPCKKLMKKLNKIYLDNKEKIEVIAISTDNASAISKVESYVKSKRLSLTVLLDPDTNVARVFNPSLKIPFTVIIDKKGDIVYSHTGYMPGYENVLLKEIEKLTNEKK